MLRFYALIAIAAFIGTAQDQASRLLNEANRFYRGNRTEEAVRSYREYLALKPDRAEVRVFLGAALLNSNQPAEALEEARRAIALDARSAKAYVLAGRIYADRQQWSIAQEFFAEAIGIDASDRDAWYFSGHAYWQSGQLPEAVHALLNAGSHSRVRETLGLVYEAAGQFAEADASFRRSVENSGGAYRPRASYGVFLFRQGRLSESIPMLQEAVRLAPDSADIRFELARTLYQSGRLTEAISVLPDRAPPGQCRIENLRSRLLIQMGQTDQAQRSMAAFQACERQ